MSTEGKTGVPGRVKKIRNKQEGHLKDYKLPKCETYLNTIKAVSIKDK